MLRLTDLGPGDRESLVFPFAHIGGMVWLLAGLTAGSAHLLVESFDSAVAIEVLAKNGVTLAGTGTPFNQAYLKAQLAMAEHHPGRRLFPDIRAFVSGAAPKPPHLHADLKVAFGGHGLVSSYGLTECPIATVCCPSDPEDKLARTEGRAAPSVKVRIVGDDGCVVGPGREGEVRLLGPQLFLGYVDSRLDHTAFDTDGFFRSGDLGVVDAEGYLTVTGRLKDVIIRKGENISAKEIEDLLSEHPAVKDVAVIGVPDPTTGERCVALIAPRHGGMPLGFDEMVGFLAGRGLMKQKLPEELVIVEKIPRNSLGKILKKQLREEFVDGAKLVYSKGVGAN
jgi:acyl-CoA synthetase (AMP-forming)/AMP-acid ligase II